MQPRQRSDAAVVGAAGDDRALVQLRAVLAMLRPLAAASIRADLEATADGALIDLLHEYRQLRSVLAAGELRVQVAFDSSQRAAAEQRGIPKRDRGKGVADQIALARGVSAHRAANDLALVKGLATELPETMLQLAAGTISEAAALAVARETVCLMPEDRAVVDQRVASRIGARTSATRAATMTRAEAARVDADSVVARIRRAESDRNVTVRPAPDAMVYLSALLPVKDGIAAYASLATYADAQKAKGDQRPRGQILADELFARLTGISDAALVPVEIQLVMPADTLVTPATPPGSGESGERRGTAGVARIGEHIIPETVAREIALITDDAAKRYIRRVFTDPVSGQVREVDERRRLFSGALRRAIELRDQACRMCGAPIRDVDHVAPFAGNGKTTWHNGQGLCRRCNQTKTLPGWRSTAFVIDTHHVVVTRTPTGHCYVSHAPPALPTSPDPPQKTFRRTVEGRLRASTGPPVGRAPLDVRWRVEAG